MSYEKSIGPPRALPIPEPAAFRPVPCSPRAALLHPTSPEVVLCAEPSGATSKLCSIRDHHCPDAQYRLSDGFCPELPPSYEQPHPFASHDVAQEDWLAFLGDIRRITQNTSEERMRETFAPESSALGGLGSGGRGGLARGLLGAIAEGVSKSMSGGASKAAQEPVSLLIAEWNRNFWNRRNIEVSLVLNDVSTDPYAYTQPSSGRGLGLRASRSPSRDCRRSRKRAERNASRTELVADVHHMLGAKESSAAYRAAADEGRYGGQPGWCLVLRYNGPAGASYAGGSASGWATRP
ncbi:hypothetical protein LXA43DRAFT_1062829 [Ganoderma leucocontextum]|nr:hypothetical protein LXA43DRAFT_1062829 [Ganoderma leucocontextum]